jgi:hypothetical protein
MMDLEIHSKMTKLYQSICTKLSSENFLSFHVTHLWCLLPSFAWELLMHKAWNCAVTSFVIFYMHTFFLQMGRTVTKNGLLCYIWVLPTMQCKIINMCRQYVSLLLLSLSIIIFQDYSRISFDISEWWTEWRQRGIVFMNKIFHLLDSKNVYKYLQHIPPCVETQGIQPAKASQKWELNHERCNKAH